MKDKNKYYLIVLTEEGKVIGIYREDLKDRIPEYIKIEKKEAHQSDWYKIINLYEQHNTLADSEILSKNIIESYIINDKTIADKISSRVNYIVGGIRIIAEEVHLTYDHHYKNIGHVVRFFGQDEIDILLDLTTTTKEKGSTETPFTNILGKKRKCDKKGTIRYNAFTESHNGKTPIKLQKTYSDLNNTDWNEEYWNRIKEFLGNDNKNLAKIYSNIDSKNFSKVKFKRVIEDTKQEITDEHISQYNQLLETSLQEELSAPESSTPATPTVPSHESSTPATPTVPSHESSPPTNNESNDNSSATNGESKQNDLPPHSPPSPPPPPPQKSYNERLKDMMKPYIPYEQKTELKKICEMLTGDQIRDTLIEMVS